MRELLLAPAHWSEEVKKVRSAYAASLTYGRAILVEVDFDTVETPSYVLTSASVDKITSAATWKKTLKDKIDKKITFKTRDELTKHLQTLLGQIRGNEACSKLEQLCSRSGQQIISDATFIKIMDACSPMYPRVTHVRWFGHGAQGRIRGSDGHNVRLGNISQIIMLSETPILSLYCCSTGMKSNVTETAYWSPDAPRYILSQVNPPAAYGPVVINSNITTTFWSAGVHEALDYPFDRHTVLSIVGGMPEDKDVSACRALHGERRKNNAIRRWGLVRQAIHDGRFRQNPVAQDEEGSDAEL